MAILNCSSIVFALYVVFVHDNIFSGIEILKSDLSLITKKPLIGQWLSLNRDGAHNPRGNITVGMAPVNKKMKSFEHKITFKITVRGQ